MCHIINRQLCASATGSHARPSHHTAPAMFYRWCGMLWMLLRVLVFSCHYSGSCWSWFHLSKDCFQICASYLFFFSKVQPILSILKAKEWLTPCSEPSVFIFFFLFFFLCKCGISIRLYPGESVVQLVGCCHNGNDSAIIHHRSFCVAEFTSAFLLPQDVDSVTPIIVIYHIYGPSCIPVGQ